MGLDSYLYEEEYLSPYRNDERYKQVCEALGRDDVKTISYEVGYWRKANHIHKWFVDQVQGGVDDCQKYFVDRDQLKKLYDTCQEVLKFAAVDEVDEEFIEFADGQSRTTTEKVREVVNASTLHSILPTSGGFFFGSTGYDEWYLRHVESTVRILDSIRNENGAFGRDGMNYYYEASW